MALIQNTEDFSLKVVLAELMGLVIVLPSIRQAQTTQAILPHLRAFVPVNQPLRASHMKNIRGMKNKGVELLRTHPVQKKKTDPKMKNKALFLWKARQNKSSELKRMNMKSGSVKIAAF
jgi:hypothetical protein